MSISDHIIQACLKGDKKAQKQLVVQSAPTLMRVALRYTHDRPTAEDVLQDSYLKIFKKLKTYKSDKGAIETWMRKITIYTAIERYRKKSWTHEVAIDPMEYIQRAYVDPNNMELDQLYELINSLPVGYRTIFNLNIIEGFSHVEIANILDISPSTSRSQLKRARNLLQHKLKQIEQMNYEL